MRSVIDPFKERLLKWIAKVKINFKPANN